VKSVVNKSGLKVDIIRSIDKKHSLEDIAVSKNLDFEELLNALEHIVASGTRIDISYYIEEVVDSVHQEEIFAYFREEAETDSWQDAIKELGENEYTEEEVRLVRIKFLSEVGN
jgi:ATP-dependent DNA helicase RecQ